MSTTETKECKHCFKELPLTAFRFDKGRYRAKCLRCDALASRELRRRRRKESINEQIEPLNWKSSRPSKVYRAVARMVDKCGGVNGLCEKWHAAVRQAEEEGDYRFVLRSVHVFVTLIEKYQRQDAPPIPTDPEGLSEFVHEKIVTMIEDRPEVVLMIAKDLGWRVAAPADSR